MNLRDEWRERVAEALPCTPRCYPATRSGHSNGCRVSRYATADALLAPGGVVAGIVAEAYAAEPLWQLGYGIGAAEVRARVEAELDDMATWCGPYGYQGVAEFIDRRDRRLREALATAQNPPSDGRTGSGEGAGTSDVSRGAERGEG